VSEKSLQREPVPPFGRLRRGKTGVFSCLSDCGPVAGCILGAPGGRLLAGLTPIMVIPGKRFVDNRYPALHRRPPRADLALASMCSDNRRSMDRQVKKVMLVSWRFPVKGGSGKGVDTCMSFLK
jgi:hypothetical protein